MKNKSSNKKLVSLLIIILLFIYLFLANHIIINVFSETKHLFEKINYTSVVPESKESSNGIIGKLEKVAIKPKLDSLEISGWAVAYSNDDKHPLETQSIEIFLLGEKNAYRCSTVKLKRMDVVHYIKDNNNIIINTPFVGFSIDTPTILLKNDIYEIVIVGEGDTINKTPLHTNSYIIKDDSGIAPYTSADISKLKKINKKLYNTNTQDLKYTIDKFDIQSNNLELKGVVNYNSQFETGSPIGIVALLANEKNTYQVGCQIPLETDIITNSINHNETMNFEIANIPLDKIIDGKYMIYLEIYQNKAHSIVISTNYIIEKNNNQVNVIR